MMAWSPADGQIYYFVDKCLPFGSSISCALFQRFSDAVAHVVSYRTKRVVMNYLDDYLFIAAVLRICNKKIVVFLQVCVEIRLPVSKRKTHWGTTKLTFLGFLIDGEQFIVAVPVDKIDKATRLINQMLTAKNSKTTVGKLQQICGFLNFLSRCIVPGLVFTRHLYGGLRNLDKLKPHHHIRLTWENKLDLHMWLQFLNHPSVFCQPFADFSKTIPSLEVDLYTDASGSLNLGCGGVSDNEWLHVSWDKHFLREAEPSIEYLELYALTVGVLLWLPKY